MRAPAAEAQLSLVQQHLGREIPSSLRSFLGRWNGASLFRGALRIRGLADLAVSSPDEPRVVLFADGPRDEDRWGYAAVPGGWHFGRWTGRELVAQHEHFPRWLYATARVLDEDKRDPLAALEVRIEVDPDCGLLHHQRGELLLAAGDGDGALKAYRRATALSPELAASWQRLGEATLSVDHAQGVHALFMALRHTSLPLPYPGASAADRSVIRTLEGVFPPGDAGWERELHQFIHERAHDVAPGTAGLLEAAGLALSRVHLARGERKGARDAVQRVFDRLAAFPTAVEMPELTLGLVALDTELGNHDEAEEALRRLRRNPDAQVRARADLALARIAFVREEPWADDIARSAWAALTGAEDRLDAALLMAERRDPQAVEDARRLATAVGDPQRLARLELVLGDLARDEGDIPAACQHYLACEADEESRCRAQIRLGDLCEDPADALPHYVAAVSGYQALGLPLREAWGRLRLVRCGDASQAEEALRIFRDAGLAAGVAAADALAGRPGHSLSWHLNLAAEHARQRYDAQRMRPPLTRADADRPERRLGAHRRAIAAGDTRVVATLAADLNTELGRLQSGDGRTRDPAAMRFVAGVDLLAGHPSFDAARTLLGLLREDLRQPAAASALLGALARSPNMALVESLLEALDTLTEPRALAQVAEVLGWRRETEAAPRLRELAATGSGPVRRAAITALGRIGDDGAVDVILPALEIPDLAEEAAVALLLLGEWRGVDFHGQALARDVSGLSQSPGEIVGRFGGPSYLLLLRGVSEREGPAGLGAIQGLGLLGSVRAIPRLIELAGARDPLRASVAGAALELVTGIRQDPEEPHPRIKWEAWWNEHGGEFDPDERYRHGKPFGVRVLVDRLGMDDPQIRQSAYEELVISTGARLPFDADGPWRMQLAHRGAWERWWADHAHTLPRTGWLFFGGPTG